MDIVIWVRVQHCFIDFMVQGLPALCYWKLFQLVPVYLFTCPAPYHCECFVFYFIFSIFYSTLWHHKMLWYHLVDFLIGSRISHFFRSSGSFYWRMVFETKIWVLGVFVTSEVVLFLRYLSWESKEICVYINQ